MIYNQHKIPKNQWRYGFRSSAATGCGWIATYNALKLLGYQASPEGLIRYYSRQLPLIHGNMGTTLFGPVVYFLRWGFPVKMAWMRKNFDELAKNSHACILFYRWRRGYRFGAHFVALEHTQQGFVRYNTYRTSEGPDHYGESLRLFLEKRNYYGAVLIGIRDKRS